MHVDIMSFLRNIRLYGVLILSPACMLFVMSTQAAEWKIEPGFVTTMQYNDNVKMSPDLGSAESSTGYTLEPRAKFSANEKGLWQLSLDASGKVTRFQDVEDSDSDNIFLAFGSARQTERSQWRLDASYKRNTNLDTDFETETPDSGLLLDDSTERNTAMIRPSVAWGVSENTQIELSLKASDVTFDEKTSQSYADFNDDSADFSVKWQAYKNHRFGVTSSYTEHETPSLNYSYEQLVVELDYRYSISESSEITLSYGKRTLESLRTDVVVACDTGLSVLPPVNGQCEETLSLGLFALQITPITQDISVENDGIVTNLSYVSSTETVSHNLNGGRSVIPSSSGGAQEVRSASYRLKIKNTERFTTSLFLSATDSETISGISSSTDRTRYRAGASLGYKLNKDWSLSFSYRHIEHNIESSDEDSSSNSIFVNLHLLWPKLATTY